MAPHFNEATPAKSNGTVPHEITNETKEVEKNLENLTQTVLTSRRRMWLFSMPRTASNTFVKMMGGHSNLANVEYEFMWGAMFKTSDRYDLSQLSDAEQEEIKTIYESAFETVVTKVADAENEGKLVFGKEHSLMCLDRGLIHLTLSLDPAASAYNTINTIPRDWTLKMPGESKPRPRTNITMLPDDFLLNWLPIFLIRHPALMIPSQVRVFSKIATAGEDVLKTPTNALSFTYHWSRMLYDWYVAKQVPAKELGSKEHQDIWPVVLDADDMVRDKAVIEKFCLAAKLDPNEVQYNWESKTEEDIGKAGVVGIFTNTLMASSGLRTDLHDHDVDIAKEHVKWQKEFGVENARVMLERVESAMVDYEYLRSKRLRA